MNTIVLEETENGEMPIDIYTKLASDRIIFLHGHIDDRLATDITATLLLKDSEDSNQKITIFINSDGGDIRSVFMIYDVMKLLSCPIETFCIGEAFDESVLILSAGTQGMRYATENSLICTSQLLSNGSMFSDISDAFILMERLKRDNKQFLAALSKNIKKPVKTLTSDLEHKRFFTARQAAQYGFIDVLVKNKA